MLVVRIHLNNTEKLKIFRELFDTQYEPAGYNIAVNVGTHAGQTIEHMIVHLIPTYVGDVSDTVALQMMI
jgi:diadenosine tetraphosphate (Ap4A) HIT family hydrolase